MHLVRVLQSFLLARVVQVAELQALGIPQRFAKELRSVVMHSDMCGGWKTMGNPSILIHQLQ